jgi:hypothetical protein
MEGGGGKHAIVCVLSFAEFDQKELKGQRQRRAEGRGTLCFRKKNLPNRLASLQLINSYFFIFLFFG